MMDDAEAKNIISMDDANNGLQQVEELHGLSNQTDVSEVTTMINLGTNTMQIAEELDQQGDESNDKTICKHDEAEVTKETTPVDAKTSSVDLVNGNTMQLLDEVHQQDDQHENIILIDNVDERDTVSSIQESQRDSVAIEMDEKLKKIEEQVMAIDTEISQFELQCSESKGRHAEYIELYKLMAESKLPLSSHREIRVFMKKADKAAQQFISNALDLQFNIEVKTKVKMTLQEERKELVELKLNRTVEKKRKVDGEEDELCAPVEAKRMALGA